ncbi:nuclease-related domain-containing protein [Alkalibacterium sp. 20]|uniref:nuclease-related domain-containing protein n=1 Tax=Alkalibacterium sp. 20 TaxID=1798803 RepID=UPI0009000988|nr:nuclease-related domain-containing protein [Alkalibacterium sp. 20]
MILKERTKSINHLLLESLNYRMDLSFNEKILYENQIKGLKGEQLFDDCMNDCQLPGLIINDLLISIRDTYYQIDSLLIKADHIYLYEVKNYSGNYHHRDGSLFSESGHALQDPLAQANRKRAYLFNLLLNFGYQTEITSYVVYINPDFYIYSLPSTRFIIFAGQLPKHFNDLVKQLPNATDLIAALGDKLVKLHDYNFRPTNLPEYNFDQLQKGILCPECFSFRHTASRQFLLCSDCGHQEKIAEAIHRSIEEFRLLFPAVLLTKDFIYEWCGGDCSKSRIQVVLKSNYRTHFAGRGTYYS